MARTYRNPANAARATAVGRDDRIAEAGEVFTPPEVVAETLQEKAVAAVVKDPETTILEPAAGDGNFFEAILRERLLASLTLPVEERLAGLARLYAVELHHDNLQRLRERAAAALADVDPELTEAHPEEIAAWQANNLLEGNYLTRHSSLLSCPPGCAVHPNLSLPATFDLIIGNPPYNPSAVYRDFTEAACASAKLVVFILPTTWKLAEAHEKFRRRVLPHLVSLRDLPWRTFQIKLHTTVATFQPGKRGATFKLNGVSSKPVGRQQRIANSILAKAYRAWPDSLAKRQLRPERLRPRHWPLHVGWKCNLERGSGRVNALQSLSHEVASPLLPTNRFTFAFASEGERAAWVRYSSTKLAAYLQSQTDSDTVSRRLPIPPLSPGRPYLHGSDDFLYGELGLTLEEIKEVERHKLFISGKAASYYEAEGLVLRPDVILGKERARCEACGSSSFHRKGCPNSTLKERTLRDGVIPEGQRTLIDPPEKSDG